MVVRNMLKHIEANNEVKGFGREGEGIALVLLCAEAIGAAPLRGVYGRINSLRVCVSPRVQIFQGLSRTAAYIKYAGAEGNAAACHRNFEELRFRAKPEMVCLHEIGRASCRERG